MRILFLAPQPFYQERGTPIAVRMMLEHLGALGHDVDLLTYAEGEDIQIPRCVIHRIPNARALSKVRPGFSVKKLGNDLLLARRMLSLLRRNRYDLIHAVEESAFIALLAKWVYGVPFVYDMDSSLPRQLMERYASLRWIAKPLNAMEASVIRHSTGVIAVCQALEDLVKQRAPNKTVVRLEDVSMLRQATDGDPDPKIQRIRPKGPIVMYVGNLESYQGIGLLLDAFRVARGRRPDAQLVIIGGEPADIEYYGQQALRLGIEAAVHFLGPRPLALLGTYLRQADVLVSPRLQGDNTPMKIYSYLDSGRPVVATRIAAHIQVLDDEIADLRPPEPGPLGEGIADLLVDHSAGQLLAARAAERIRRNFSAEAFSLKLRTFYAGLAADCEEGQRSVACSAPA